MRSGMVPFKRALVSFYRPSIVTFPLCLRVSEILPLLFSSMPLFPYPTSSSLPKISPCSPGTRWIAFWLQRAKVLGQLFVQLVSKFSNLCDHNPPTLQTDRQTDTLQCNQRRNRGDLIETYYKILTGKERVDSQTGHRYSQRARAFEEIVCSNNGSKVILRHESDQQSKCVATTCSQCTIDKCFQEQTEQWTDMGA